MPTTTEHFTSVSSGGNSVAADVALPASTGQSPAVLILHGTDGLSPRFGPAILSFADALAARGIVAVVAHYFQSTGITPGEVDLDAMQTQLPRWTAACDDALQFMRHHARVDGARLGVLGFSLGGNLALSLGATPPAGTTLRCAVDFFGPTVMPPLRGAVAALPPVQIHHGTADRAVPIEQSNVLVDALRAAGRTPGHGYDFYTYPGEGHGFADDALRTARARTVSFFETNL